MIPSVFTYKEDRSLIADYPYLMPTSGLVSILNSPYVIHDNYLNNIFRAFQLDVWILLCFSYLIIVFLNFFGNKSLRVKIWILIDYLMLLLGQSWVEFRIIKRSY